MEKILKKISEKNNKKLNKLNNDISNFRIEVQEINEELSQIKALIKG